MLNHLVGMLSGNKETAAAPPPRAVPTAAAAAPKPAATVMRREAMLGRDQKVAAYTFLLRRALDDQRDSNLPDVQRLYDETLLGNLQRMDIARLLGQRLAFASARLDLPLIDGWPVVGTVWPLAAWTVCALPGAGDCLRAGRSEQHRSPGQADRARRGRLNAVHMDALLWAQQLSGDV